MDAIKYFMEEGLISIDSSFTVLEAIKTMKEKGIGAILVSENDTILGIFTETDLLRRVIGEERNPRSVIVKDVMSHPLQTIDSESTMVTAFLLMQQRNIRHLAVTENKKIKGILSIKDIANYYVNKFKR